MKHLLVGLLIGALLILSGCECLSGFGRDMQKAGQWVEEKAEEGPPVKQQRQ